jgi:hypothetical protein
MRNNYFGKFQPKTLLVLGACAGALSVVNSANASLVPLFVTQNDWSSTNWIAANGSTLSTVPSTTFDADLSAVNGGGNETAAGGVGTPGSLQVAFGGNGFADLGEISGEQSNAAFLAAFDPGGNATTAAAYSGTVQLYYTQPTLPNGGYFQIGLFLQYSGDGYYGPMLSSSQVASSVGTNTTGETEMVATIPYTIVAGPWNGFGFGLFVNTDAAGSQNFYVDGLSAVTVPEPASLCGLGALGGLLLLRRRVAV